MFTKLPEVLADCVIRVMRDHRRPDDKGGKQQPTGRRENMKCHKAANSCSTEENSSI
jgi:hypothetical protein